MNYPKLLAKQVAKYLPESLANHPELSNFLEVVSESYKALERDKELAERAFRITEEEYTSLNKKLKHEFELKKLSVRKLKEAVGTITGVEKQNDSEDLLAIARYLNQQVTKRKNAEVVFTSLITNIDSGILLEDENRKIVFTNNLFCKLFGIPADPESLQGNDCTDSAEQNKAMFKDPDLFVSRITHILKHRELVTGEILELTNGNIFQRDYIPIFIENNYKGHLWRYTDITVQRSSQEAIEQSELKNRLIMNAALDAIITIDIAGVITFWNPQAEHIFGWKASDAIGKKLSDLIIPKSRRVAHHKGMDHYIHSGEERVLNKQLELRAINSQGKEFPIELYIIPVIQGNEKSFCSFIRDISIRNKNEEDLQRLSLVAKANQNGVLFTTPDGRITWANEGFCQLTGFSPEEVIGKTPIELCKGALTDFETLQRVVDSFFKGIAFNTEIIYYRKNGTWFWGRSTSQPLKNNHGTITEYFGIIEDITNEKAVQQRLKVYEERLKIALSNVGDNYWEHDFKTGKTYFSNPNNSLLGFIIDDKLDAASLWWSRIHPADKEILVENDQKYKAGLIDHHNCEYRMFHQDGTIRWVLDRGVVTELDEHKKPGTIIGTHIDITQQKQTEQELINAKDDAEKSTRAKESFLANMSHEIRTPMNAIMGMANQLNKTTLTADQQSYLGMIRSATDNLLIIINDILDLSKIEAGHIVLEKIGFELNLVLSRAIQVMIHKAEEKGLEFTNSFCDSKLAGVLIGDPYRLNQILLNLISNAIKFTEKGNVDVSYRVIEDLEEFQMIEITVKDTGIGMDESFTRHLFQKFKQEDESFSRRFGGTGLGMNICRELVLLMGGTIQVRSKKGQGTSISFSIPFQKGNEFSLPAKSTEEIDTSIIFGKKILVTDDNEMNRMVASTVLKNYGADISEAQNGLEAIDKIMNQQFDIVLMDVQMPLMGGIEAVTEIRRSISQTLPVVALTALAIKGDRDKFLEAGMTDYLSKPFDENQLIRVVSRSLAK